MNLDKQLWERNIRRYNLVYPSEHVVRFLAKTYGDIDKSTVKLLDFGCGSGRNTYMMLEQGYNVYAVDCNEFSLEIVRGMAESQGKTITTKRNDETDIPFEDDLFDCIIAFGATFLLPDAKRRVLMSNLSRVLKPSGKLFANWRTTNDFLYQKGKEIEKDVYLLDDRCAQFGLAGMTYYFSTLSDLKELYAEIGLTVENVDKLEFYINNMTVCNSHFHIWARK